jgi:hypothetical protein
MIVMQWLRLSPPHQLCVCRVWAGQDKADQIRKYNKINQTYM